MLKKSSILTVVLVVLAFLPASAFAKSIDMVKFTDVEVPKEMVANDVVAIGGSVTVLGRIEGNVVAVGGSVTLKARSYVGGQVVVIGGSLVKDPDAEVAGKITQIDMPHFIPSLGSFMRGTWLAVWATISILSLLGFLGLAILLVALAPEHMVATVSMLEKAFVNMLLRGILGMMLIVPVAALLAISIIGIILIPLEILLVALAFVIGYIAAAILIGKNILIALKKAPVPFIDAILGIFVLFLIGFVPLAGPLVKIVLLTAGFGAVLTTRFGTVK